MSKTTKLDDVKLLETMARLTRCLRDRRIELKMSQESLSKKCGVSKIQIIRIENNQVWPGMGYIQCICEALKLSFVLIDGKKLLEINKLS